jgi:hypothetical protein
VTLHAVQRHGFGLCAVYGSQHIAVADARPFRRAARKGQAIQKALVILKNIHAHADEFMVIGGPQGFGFLR